MTEDRIPYDVTEDDLQGTDEWRQERAGCITASCMRALRWTPGEFYKTGPKAGTEKPAPQGRMTYIDQLVAEILTGQAKENVTAKAMEHGKEFEPEAIAAYEAKFGRLVEQVGFVRHPDYPFIGASPDFLVNADGGGEIKCPMSIVVHATTLREGLPEEHVEQIQGGLWVTGRLWWDFVSYHAAFPEHLRLYVQRVHRDNAAIALLKRDCLSAWDEAQAVIARLNAQGGA